MKALNAIACILLPLSGVAAPALAQTAPTESCANNPLFRQSDFILGKWDVFDGDRKTAEVTIEARLDGCTLLETWVTPAGAKGNGLGLMTYSALLKNWNYHWAADTGNMTVFSGSLRRAGEMLYVTERPARNGKTRLRHWTLTAQPDGRIRELSVGTEDNGKTWTTEYDLTWIKKG